MNPKVEVCPLAIRLITIGHSKDCKSLSDSQCVPHAYIDRGEANMPVEYCRVTSVDRATLHDNATIAGDISLKDDRTCACSADLNIRFVCPYLKICTGMISGESFWIYRRVFRIDAQTEGLLRYAL